MREAQQPAGSSVISRRRLLQAGSLAGFGAFLAACSGSSGSSSAPAGSVAIPTPPPESPSPSAPASPTPKPSPTGPLKFANWPAYIDLSGKAGEAQKYAPGSSPTIEQFKKKYGVGVDYVEAIEDNKIF